LVFVPVHSLDDTIAAIATPLGEGGLAVIRISGREALGVADRCFTPVGKNSQKPSQATSHTIHYGKVMRAGVQVDEVLCAVMRAPRTYTREDIVEITCHGGILSSKTVLDTVLESGARLAEPGEFTQRAFLNGRLDLTQAEAVLDMIHSRTELALSVANEQLAGKLGRRINELRDGLMETLAHLEAYIDFPEEDIEPETQAQLDQRMAKGIAFMEELLRTANEGQVLRQGVRAAIIGRPNAGKSSLLNQLLGRDRAIVSPIPGTTRDTIEETANVRGIPVVFVDTAGLREAQDGLEAEGIRRSRESLARAEFILHVLDASEVLTEQDEKYLKEFVEKKRIIVCNKVDLPRKLAMDSVRSSAFRRPVSPEPPEGGTPILDVVDVSCATGQGIEMLKDAIKSLVWSGEIKSEMLEVMINSRHQDALRRGHEATSRALAALRNGESLEFPALELHIAVNAIGEVVGKTATEDLLDIIFKQFCIGK
jgi:tRNA modification GTPase